MSLTRNVQVSRVTLFALALAAPVIALAVSAQGTTAITTLTTATAAGIETPVVIAPDDMSWQ